MVCPDNGMLFSTKTKWATKLWKDVEKTRIHILREGSNLIRLYPVWSHLCDILEKAKLWRWWKTSVVSGVCVWCEWAGHKGVLGQCKYYNNSLWHCTLIQIHWFKTPRVNPKLNYRVWWVWCQCKYILGNKYITVLSEVCDGGRSVHVWYRGYIGNINTSLSISL